MNLRRPGPLSQLVWFVRCQRVRLRRPAAFLCLVLGTSSLLGCPSRPTGELTTALIPSGSLPRVELVGMSRHDPVASYRFQAMDSAGWTIEPPPRESELERGILLAAGAGGRIRLDGRIGVEADEVHLVEIELKHGVRGQLHLFWRSPDQKYSARRKVTAALEPATRTIRLPMFGRQLWDGQIRSVRIDLVTQDEVILREVRLLSLRLEGETMASSPAWRAALQADSRRSVLVGSGETSHFAVPPHQATHVSFSLGAPLGRCRVGVSEGGAVLGEWVAGPAWRQREFDLPERAEGYRLQFEAEEHCVAYVANPRLTASGRPTAHDGPRRNVLLIIVDTLRADRFDREKMPKLFEWFETRGRHFERAFAPAPWTLPSHISMFTGVGTLGHGLNYGEPLSDPLVSVVERFHEAGYRTLASAGGGYLSPSFGLDRGFERFGFWSDPVQNEKELETGVQRLESWLSESDPRPYFALLHTYEVHRPYRKREPWYPAETEGELPVVRREPAGDSLQEVRRFYTRTADGLRDPTDEEMANLRLAYDSGVAYTDDRIAALLARLEEQGTLDNTLVVLTSDHGEALGELGYAAHSYPHDFNLAIPLAMTVPGGSGESGGVSSVVSLIDLPATLTTMALGEPWNQGEGLSLEPLLHGQTLDRREIVSYSGSSNFGMTLRYRDRLRLILMDTVIGPRRGWYELSEAYSEVEGVSNEIESIPPSLLAHAHDLLRAAAGDHLTVRNESAMEIQATLRNLGARHVKAVSLPPTVVSSHRAGQVDFRIPPGTTLELRLERPAAQRNIELHFRWSGGECRVEEILDGRDLAWSVDLETGDCSSGSGKGLLVNLRRVGTGSDAPVEVAIEGELAEQLKSLGYLD